MKTHTRMNISLPESLHKRMKEAEDLEDLDVNWSQICSNAIEGFLNRIDKGDKIVLKEEEPKIKTEYKTIITSKDEDLDKYVSEHLAAGWECQGGLVIAHAVHDGWIKYGQALIRKVKQSKTSPKR